MSKIVALNQPKVSEKPKKDEDCSNELQETLAENEYKRAIRLKMNGYYDNSLSLLNELLETKVLNEITQDDKNKKLWSIRFNCFKNLAYIYEEHMDEQTKALENYIAALSIDNSDVYLSQRCAQLAFKMNQLEIAEYWFENCLKFNKKHWIAADGLLKTLCQSNNIFGAYYLAAKYYHANPKNPLALKVLQDIKYRFLPMFKIFNECYNPIGKGEIDLPPFEFDMNSKSVFNLEPNVPPIEKEEEPDLMRFQLKTFNWQTVGKYTIDLHNYLKRNKLNSFFRINFEDFYLEPPPEEKDPSDGQENNKPKKRKRITDIELLQQWHWWPKNKSQKNVRLDPPTDGSLFLKYYLQDECKVCKALKKTSNDFDFQTKHKLEKFKNDLKTIPFDLIRLMEFWLKYISSLWSIPIPCELISLYLEAFRIYQPQFNIPSLNPVQHVKELRITMDIYLLYLELEMDKVEGNNKPTKEWTEMFFIAQHLIALLGVQLGEDLLTYQLRLLNMEYLYAMHNNMLVESLGSILAFQDALKNERKDFVLHLPNGHCIDKEELVEIRYEIEEELREQEKKQSSPSAAKK